MSRDNIANLSCNRSSNLIAFDFDGTIVNCEIRQIEVLRSILRRKEININNFNFEKWWNLKTNGFNTYDALIELGINKAEALEIFQSWISIIENPEWLDLDRIKPYILKFFQKLSRTDIGIIIISARQSEYFFNNQINKLQIKQFITKSYVVDPKNSIEEKKAILNKLKPLIFIGDTESDYYSSIKSGITFFGVTDGQRSEQYLIKIGVENIIDNFLKQIYDQIFRFKSYKR